MTLDAPLNDISQQLKDCLNLLTKILKKDLLGIYLYGSFVAGGFHKYSDIDLLVVTHRPATKEEKIELTTHLLEISGIYMKGPKPPLEITLVEKAAINPWKYPPIFDFQYGEWLRSLFEMGNFDPYETFEMPDLALIITQVLLKSHTLLGPPPKDLLAPVPYFDFITAMLHDLERLSCDLEQDTRNVLLTYARIWSTLATNEIRSKPDAADWVTPLLPQIYQPVMQRAKAICLGLEDEKWDDLQELIKPCAEFMLSKIQDLPLKDPSHTIKLAQ